MEHLVPEKRLDRNGRLVTRHVLPSSPASKTTHIPAPSVQRKAVFSPSDEQMVAKKTVVSGNYVIINDSLNAALKRRSKPISFTASDIEMYDMLSILRPFDAAILMTYGINTPDKARSWLSENDLERLIVDKQDFATQALKRGIPADAYLRLCAERYVSSIPDDRLLDVAELFGKPELKEVPLWEDVLRGNARIEDIRKVGPERIEGCFQYGNDSEIREFFTGLKDKAIDLDAPQLQAIFEKKYGIRDAPALIEKFGYEKAVSFYSLQAASSMWKYLSYQNDEYKIPRIDYYDDMARASNALIESGIVDRNLSWSNFQYSMVLSWYDHGLTPEEAVDCHRKAITLEDVFKRRLGEEAIGKGVEPSISSGWL